MYICGMYIRRVSSIHRSMLAMSVPTVKLENETGFSLA